MVPDLLVVIFLSIKWSYAVKLRDRLTRQTLSLCHLFVFMTHNDIISFLPQVLVVFEWSSFTDWWFWSFDSHQSE